MSARAKVTEALRALSSEGRARPGLAAPLFSSWASAADVAKRAGVSITTARRYLDQLAMCQGYAKHRFARGAYGYRWLDA